MLLTVDLIRHAESGMNVDMANAEVPYIGGRQNEIDLSFDGELQAIDLGEYADAENIVPTDFVSSPAVRTRRTHELSSTAMGLTVVPLFDDRLQELDQGEWTKQPRSLYDDPEIEAEMKRLGSDFAPPGGESMNAVCRRTDASLGSLVTRFANEGPRHVWVHTHGVVIKTYIGHLLGWTHEQTYKTGIDNVSMTRIVHDGDAWRVVFVNRPTSNRSKSDFDPARTRK
jgi:broad specificity phosphatase PhoE